MNFDRILKTNIPDIACAMGLHRTDIASAHIGYSTRQTMVSLHHQYVVIVRKKVMILQR